MAGGGTDMTSDLPKPASSADPHHAAQQDGSALQGRRGQVARVIAFFDSTTKVLVALGGLIAAGAAIWAGIANFTPHGAPSAGAYSPATYASQIDDHFTTGDLSSYALVRSVVAGMFGDVAPAWSVGGGQASATAAQPWFGILISSAAPATPQATAVVDVKALDSGATNQHSGVWVGLVRDSSNQVMVWYNSHYHTSGEAMVLNGVLNPPGFQAACCASVILQPERPFRLQARRQHGDLLLPGVWQRAVDGAAIHVGRAAAGPDRPGHPGRVPLCLRPQW